MKVKIYTNDGEHHYYGFDVKWAELTMVHSFDFPFEIGKEIFNREWMLKALDRIYMHLQAGVPIQIDQWATEYFGKQLRSLSVGDVIAFGETAWSVDDSGFTLLTTDHFKGTIIWDDELNGVPS